MVLVPGDQPDLHVQAMFDVKFDHFVERVGFMTCSELAVVAETFRHAEGGDPVGEEFISGFTFNDLTMTRGLDKRPELQNWWEETFDSRMQLGRVASRYKHNGEVRILNLDGTVGLRYELERAFMKGWTPMAGVDASNKTSPVTSSVIFGIKKWHFPGIG